jgi:hypothetical protein
MYKVTKQGQMQRINEVPIKMGRKFFPSMDANMTLTLSKDKRLISLLNFDQDNSDGDYF